MRVKLRPDSALHPELGGDATTFTPTLQPCRKLQQSDVPVQRPKPRLCGARGRDPSRGKAETLQEVKLGNVQYVDAQIVRTAARSIHTYISVCVHITYKTHAHICIYIYIFLSLSLSVCLCVSMYVCVCVCMYACTHTLHIRTYVCTCAYIQITILYIYIEQSRAEQREIGRCTAQVKKVYIYRPS